MESEIEMALREVITGHRRGQYCQTVAEFVRQALPFLNTEDSVRVIDYDGRWVVIAEGDVDWTTDSEAVQALLDEAGTDLWVEPVNSAVLGVFHRSEA